MVGHGIRLALDVGAHRRKVYDSKPTIENELWKRAFWYVSLHIRLVFSIDLFFVQVSCSHGPIGEFCAGATLCDSGSSLFLHRLLLTKVISLLAHNTMHFLQEEE